MKTNILSFLLILLMGPLSAKAITIDFIFDLVEIDDEMLVEPPGELTVSVTLDTSGDPTAANPLTKQILADAASEGLSKVREILKEQINETSRQIKEALKTAKKNKAYGAPLKAEIDAYLMVLQTTYEAMSRQAGLEADARIRLKWADMLKSRKDLKVWRLKTAWIIGSNSFGLAVDVAGAASSGGVSLVADLIGIVDRSVTLVKTFKQLGINESKARKAMVTASGKVKRKISPTTRLNKGERVQDLYAGLENQLESAMALHRVKLEVVRARAKALAFLLEKSFAIETELKKNTEVRGDKDMMAALGKIEAARADYLKSIDQLAETMSTGEKLQKETAALLKAARLDNPSSGVIGEVVSGAKAIEGLSDTIGSLIEPCVGTLLHVVESLNDAKSTLSKFHAKHKKI